MHLKTMLGIATAVGTMLMNSSSASAKEGTTVKGENGTVWCCPNGKKGPDCGKGTAGTPIGKPCDFAEKNTKGDAVDPKLPGAARETTPEKRWNAP